MPVSKCEKKVSVTLLCVLLFQFLEDRSGRIPGWSSVFSDLLPGSAAETRAKCQWLKKT